MDKSNLVSNYENTETTIEKAVKQNRDFTHAAFFSLGLSGIGAVIAASAKFEPVLAGGAAAVATGLTMGTYFFMSTGKNTELINAKQRLLEKIYKLMPEQDKEFIKKRSIPNKENAIQNIQAIRDKNVVENTAHTIPINSLK